MTDARSRRFARVYYDDLERDFPGVFYDPTCLSTWLRLLVLSEKSWPALPEIPRAARRADLEKLRAEGVMVDHPNERYELRGWVKERDNRATTARANVGARWSARNNDGTTTVKPSKYDGNTAVSPLVIPVRAGASASASISDVTEGVQGEPNSWDAFQSRTGEIPGEKMRVWLDELSDAHSEARVVAMLGQLPKTQRTSVDYLKAVRDALRAQDFEAEKAERAAEKASVAAKRRPVVLRAPVEDISDEEAKRLATEYMRGGAA